MSRKKTFRRSHKKKSTATVPLADDDLKWILPATLPGDDESKWMPVPVEPAHRLPRRPLKIETHPRIDENLNRQVSAMRNLMKKKIEGLPKKKEKKYEKDRLLLGDLIRSYLSSPDKQTVADDIKEKMAAFSTRWKVPKLTPPAYVEEHLGGEILVAINLFYPVREIMPVVEAEVRRAAKRLGVRYRNFSGKALKRTARQVELLARRAELKKIIDETKVFTFALQRIDPDGYKEAKKLGQREFKRYVERQRQIFKSLNLLDQG